MLRIRSGNRVLIDTWWNVNKNYKDFQKWRLDGFNRYMVECELLKINGVLWAVGCFNRYMVECESLLTAQQLSEILVLIDTWWNVNFVSNSWVLGYDTF